MPRFQPHTEYESAYSRQLWTSEARANYFQLVEDRQLRLLKAITHSPIHWERDEDPKLEQVIQATDERKSPDKISSKLSPVPPAVKSAWGQEPVRETEEVTSPQPPSEYSDYVHLELEPEEPKKRNLNQRTPSPTEMEDRKKMRTPSQSPKIFSRPMSAPNKSNSVPSVHSRCSSRSSIGLDFSKTHGQVTAKNLKKTPNLSTYTRAYTGTNIERQVMNRPRIFEDRKRNHTAKPMKFQKLSTNRYKEKKGNNLPRDISAWSTEYRGNFKSFKV